MKSVRITAKPERIRIADRDAYDRLKQAGFKMHDASLYQVSGPLYPPAFLIVGFGVDTRLMVAYNRLGQTVSAADINAALEIPVRPKTEIRIRAGSV